MSLITKPFFSFHLPKHLQEGLVLLMLFNEGEGTKVYDLSGNNYHGTIYGGASWVKLPNGKWALYFNGVDSYVSLNLSPQLNPNIKGYTLVLWLNPRIERRTIMYGGGIRYSIGFSVGDFYLRLYGYDEEGNCRTVTGLPLNLNAWNFISVSFNLTDFRLYINGAEKVVSNPWPAPLEPISVIYIGREAWALPYFDGFIAPIFIYDLALNSSEVKELYQITRGLVGA